MQRKLVSIRKINNIFPIPRADRIEVAVVDGWEVVVSKGTYKIDDMILYYEIDSFIPADDKRYKLMNEKPQDYNGISGNRLKTIKLRGQVSQGLVMPISEFPEITKIELGEDVHDFKVGDHFTTVFLPSCQNCHECKAGIPANCSVGAKANASGQMISGGSRISIKGDSVNHYNRVITLSKQ